MWAGLGWRGREEVPQARLETWASTLGERGLEHALGVRRGDGMEGEESGDRCSCPQGELSRQDRSWG